MKKARDVGARFWEKVARGEAGACWLWSKKLDGHGKGRFLWNGKNMTASRVAWLLTFGEPDPGRFVVPVCRDSRCCNPDHLRSVTRLQMLREYTKRRGGRLRHPALNDEQVAAVRRLASVSMGYRSIARGLGLPQQEVMKTMRALGLKGRGYGGQQKNTPESFWERLVVRAAPNDCWPCTRTRSDRDGYGKVRMSGGPARPAHRVAWELTNGPIPEGMWVLHRCDNPPCCNPAHLFLGTPADNAADMARKGRSALGPKNARYQHGRYVGKRRVA